MRRLVSKKARTTRMQVAEEFYDAIENARRNFARKYKIGGIKTTQFTRLLATKFPSNLEVKRNVMRKKR